jgi:hypothetical protein
VGGIGEAVVCAAPEAQEVSSNAARIKNEIFDT